MALFVAKNGSLQTIKGIYYGMTEYYINATLFHNLVPNTTATEIRFLYASDNPDLTGYNKLGYCDNLNFIEVWNSGTKYILINPRKNYIYAPTNCSIFLYKYMALVVCNIENFNTQNVTNMSSMFCGCGSLKSLDLSSFNTQNVTNMFQMFYGCGSLKSLDLSNFNTQNVTIMRNMFNGCSRLTSLDLSSFNTQNVTNMHSMFHSCRMLQLIKSNSFIRNTSLNSDSMFYNCTSLIGGNGTPYSSAHTNAEYARVDGEDGLPGYFTAPTN